VLLIGCSSPHKLAAFSFVGSRATRPEGRLSGARLELSSTSYGQGNWVSFPNETRRHTRHSFFKGAADPPGARRISLLVAPLVLLIGCSSPHKLAAFSFVGSRATRPEGRLSGARLQLSSTSYGQGSRVSFPNGYMGLVEDLAAKLEVEDPSSPIPRLLIPSDSYFSTELIWNVGRHYMILADAAGRVTAWAWVDEEAEWWHLQNVWVAHDRRGEGLGSHMMRYIESAHSFVAAQRGTPSELRLTALGPAIGFYEKLGLSRLGGSVVFSKPMSAAHAEFKSSHECSKVWRRKDGESFGFLCPEFRLHVVPPASDKGFEAVRL